MAAALVHTERARDRCEQATGAAFLAAEAAPATLATGANRVIADCSGSEPLARVAAGLRIERPRAATRLAAVAVDREPANYVAWAVLSISAPPAQARAAARRARALNPLSASAAGP